jgi:hypothetical protein
VSSNPAIAWQRDICTYSPMYSQSYKNEWYFEAIKYKMYLIIWPFCP